MLLYIGQFRIENSGLFHNFNRMYVENDKLTLCMLGNFFMLLMSSADFFQN